MKYDFDVVVIGGGAGGLFAASVANALGAKTGIVEKNRLGGDCTWFGCMPSKALIKSAYVAHLYKNMAIFGLKTEGVLNTEGVLSYVNKVVEEISTHHPNEVFEIRGMRVIIGAPCFLNSQEVVVNGQRIKAKKFILCTGSHPVIAPIKGVDRIDCLTNETIFSLKSLPKSIIVLGGGPIGVEISQSLARLGVKVNLVEIMARILSREDKEVSAFLEKQLIDDGIVLLASREAIEFGKDEDGVWAIVEDTQGRREKITAEQVLVAIGRAPNLEGLNLEKAGVEYTKKRG